MIFNGKNFLIGHNLDMNMEIPGMIYINKRGLDKESISFVELFDRVTDSLPKLKWVSKYGSVTYNPLGRELIDGGLNEAGLYIGEMSLNQNHQYPVYTNKPKIAVALWLQYILDSFVSVEEVVKFVSEVTLDGKGFNWHFFVTDKNGNQAIIEFINGKTIIYQNDEIPVKLLCNNQYSMDMDTLKQYKGYGGNRDIDFKDKSQEYRSVRGAQMLEFNKQNPAESDMNYAFDILKHLDFGITKWSIVFDVKNMKMYYRTNKDTDIKHFDFSSIDFSCKEPVMMLDINKDLSSGDVIEYFVPYTKQANKAQLEKIFTSIGMKEEKTFPELIERFANYPETVKCK
jgi:penicillin V acylase-like amidase (Ntn superfamily)